MERADLFKPLLISYNPDDIDEGIRKELKKLRTFEAKSDITDWMCN